MQIKYKNQILNTIWDDKIVITHRLLNVARKSGGRIEVAKVLALAKFNNITLKNADVLWDLTDESLKEVQLQLGNYQGVTLFNITKEYGLEEAFKTIAQYLRDYGNFDIPDRLWLNTKNLPKFDASPKTIEFVGPEIYETALARIFSSAKNPDSRDYSVLYNLKNAESVECGHIINKDVLKCALANTIVNFKPINVAQIRIYARTYNKLRTSQKTLIMRELNKFSIADILDDFATNKSDWKKIEKIIIPTQRRYAKYATSNLAFRFLRNSEFWPSNNSQIEAVIKSKNDSKFKFQQLCERKSPQFAIRNFTRIYNPNEADALFEEISNTDIKLKQLVELYNALSLKGNTRTARIKGKFWTRKALPISYNSALEPLKEIIAQRIQKLAKSFAVELMKNEDLRAQFDNASQVKIPVDALKNYALPINTDKFMVSEQFPLLTRGSKLPVYQDKIGVFVSWKRKDGKEDHQDIDLSANIVDSDYSGDMLGGSPAVEVVNYTHLVNGYFKHSGDFTSCMEYNPENGFITTEMITTDLSKCKNKDIHFMINTFNGVSLKEFDVYVGICDAKFIENIYNKKEEVHSTFRLEDAIAVFKIAGDIAGYYKLFTITDNHILFEGTEMSGITGYSSIRAVLSAAQAQVYTDSLRSYSVYDFVSAQYPGKEEVNVAKLKLFLDYAVNKGE